MGWEGLEERLDVEGSSPFAAAHPWAGPSAEAVIAPPLCSPSITPTIRCSAKWQLGSLIHEEQQPRVRGRALIATLAAVAFIFFTFLAVA